MIYIAKFKLGQNLPEQIEFLGRLKFSYIFFSTALFVCLFVFFSCYSFIYSFMSFPWSYNHESVSSGHAWI